MPYLRRKLSWQKKLCFGFMTTVFVYGTLEVVLWLCGVRTIETVRDPFVGFQAGVPLFIEQDGRFVTNPLRTANFNIQEFPVRKAAGTFRIFCLGGSTTFGHPYDARIAYPQCLQRRLERLEPGRRFEVINCGGVSYASYRLTLIVDELAEYQPDLFIVHTGHNEFLEDRTYHDIRERPEWADKLTAIGAKLRTVALLSSLIEACKPPAPESILAADVVTVLEQSNGPQTYHRDDELHQKVLEHLEFSLHRIRDTARSAGAGVIFVGPASDLRGMSPFKSEYSITDRLSVLQHQEFLRSAEAERVINSPRSQLTALEKAVALDPRHADGQWALANALLQQGKAPEAYAGR